MKLHSREVLAKTHLQFGTVGLWLFAFLLLWPGPGVAQTYPNKSVRIIVAQAAGGASDLLIRMLAGKLENSMGQQFIVDNRPGAGANIGAEIAAKQAPDGYNLFMVSAPHAVAPSLYKRLKYDLQRDFAPIALFASEPLLIVVHPTLPIRNVRQFVAFLKAHPGEVSYGSSGNGAINHLAAELFKSTAGVDMAHVPYKGSRFAIPDLITGRIQVLFANVSPLLPHIRAGKLRPIAVTSSKRSAPLPEVPTIAESGYPGFDVVNWFGMMAPQGTPADIIAKLNSAISKAMSTPQMRNYLQKRGALPMSSSPEEMRAFLKKEIGKWAKVVKVSGARID